MKQSSGLIVLALSMILPTVAIALQALKKSTPAKKPAAAQKSSPKLSAANQQAVNAGKSALAAGDTAKLLGTPLTTALASGPTTAALHRAIQDSPNASPRLKEGVAAITALVTAPGVALNPKQAAAATAALSAFVAAPVTPAATAAFFDALKAAGLPGLP